MKTVITGINMTVTPGIEIRVEKKTARMCRYRRPDTERHIRITNGRRYDPPRGGRGGR